MILIFAYPVSKKSGALTIESMFMSKIYNLDYNNSYRAKVNLKS